MKFKKSYLIIFVLLIMLAACSDSKKNEDETTGDHDAYSDNDGAGDAEISDEDIPETPDESAQNPDFEDLECGSSFGDYACDFTLPLDTGDWNFAENYSKAENYLFVFYRPAKRTSTQIWSTTLYNLFDKAPDNIHFFFIVETDDADLAKEKIQIMKDSVEDAFYMSGNSEILKKIHFVSKPFSGSDSWISEWLRNNSVSFFGIDRERRIRQGGSFSGLDDIYKEAEYYDYEKKMSDLPCGFYIVILLFKVFEYFVELFKSCYFVKAVPYTAGIRQPFNVIRSNFS